MKIDKKKGWFKVYRGLYDTHVWLKSSPEHCKVLITLMGMVNHATKEWEYKGSTVMCKAGQVITSLDAIQGKCGKGISIQNIRSALKRFEKLGFLTDHSSNDGRCITICNWADYQSKSNTEKQSTNRQPTGKSHSGNRRPTSNKNEENYGINLKKMLTQNKKNEIRANK